VTRESWIRTGDWTLSSEKLLNFFSLGDRGKRATSSFSLRSLTLIFRLDAAQNFRVLSPGERWLRRTLKLAILGLASLERTIARQQSRLRWLKEGDANSKLFHAVANGGRTKNYIPSVKVGDEVITDQIGKNQAFTNAYSELIGSIKNREHGIDLSAINLPSFDLQDLEGLFSEEEVWGVIKEMPADRALGPDGFIGAFYQRAWQVTKHVVMAWMLKLAVGDGRGFGRLNRALITARPIHLLLVENAPVWLLDEIDKWLRVYFLGRERRSERRSLFGGMGLHLSATTPRRFKSQGPASTGLALGDHGDRGWGENLFLEGYLNKWANSRGFSSSGICSGSQEKKKQSYGSTSAN
jgi:hypothetical protein